MLSPPKATVIVGSPSGSFSLHDAKAFILPLLYYVGFEVCKALLNYFTNMSADGTATQVISAAAPPLIHLVQKWLTDTQKRVVV